MNKITGGCHCGNISYLLEIPDAPFTYNPRACDCRLCMAHGASYLSDVNGSLTIRVEDEQELHKYRLGTHIADFLICRTCGVLVGVCYHGRERIYGAVNTRSTLSRHRFGPSQVVSPKQLTSEERVKRWEDIWFSNVEIKYKQA